MTVTFTPTMEGARPLTLTVASNDANPSQTYAVTGTGTRSGTTGGGGGGGSMSLWSVLALGLLGFGQMLRRKARA